jgi:hypothetical protein
MTKIEIAIGSLAPWPVDGAQFWRGEGSARPGKGGGVLRGSPTTDSKGWTAPRACRRGGSAAPASGGRCELAFGEAAVRPGQYAALEAPGDPSEGG